jgi:hypothetical protein
MQPLVLNNHREGRRCRGITVVAKDLDNDVLVVPEGGRDRARL